jgi:hypothetical protein
MQSKISPLFSTKILYKYDVYVSLSYLFDSDFESEPEHEDDKDVSTQKNDITRRKKLKRYRRNYVVPEIVDGLQVRRNMGAQKWRRVENGF